MKKYLTVLQIVTALSMPSVSAFASDRWEGMYSGANTCFINHAQCWVKIDKNDNDKYTVSLTVADRIDAKKVECEISGDDFEIADGYFRGTWDGHLTEISGPPEEYISISGPEWREGMLCGFMLPREHFFIFGDY